jgi:hypothetical protein
VVLCNGTSYRREVFVYEERQLVSSGDAKGRDAEGFSSMRSLASRMGQHCSQELPYFPKYVGDVGRKPALFG